MGDEQTGAMDKPYKVMLKDEQTSGSGPDIKAKIIQLRAIINRIEARLGFPDNESKPEPVEYTLVKINEDLSNLMERLHRINSNLELLGDN